jgi:uncharacterized delta-60 repeat protein
MNRLACASRSSIRAIGLFSTLGALLSSASAFFACGNDSSNASPRDAAPEVTRSFDAAPRSPDASSPPLRADAAPPTPDAASYDASREADVTTIADAGSDSAASATADASPTPDGDTDAAVTAPYDGPTGVLDPTFGNGGIVDLAYPLDSGYYAYANALAIDSKQRIVVAGASTPDGLIDAVYTMEAAVVRFLPDGTPDPSFADSGALLSNFGLSNSHRAGGVAVEPDDSLLVSGFFASNTGGFFVAHLDATGALDTAFGDAGGVLQTPLYGDVAYPILLQPGGFLVGGWEGQGADSWMALWRYGRTGALDTTFGTSGQTLVNFGTGEDAELLSLGVQSTGHIVAAGYVIDSTTLSYQTAVVRYTASGNLDTTFGTQGIATLGQAAARALVVQPDDRIVLVGRNVPARGGSGPALIWRLLPDGGPDTTFGTNGQTSMGLGQSSDAVGIALQHDGRIVVVGDNYDSAETRMVVLRLMPDGTADPDFSTVSTYASVAAGAVAIQADGKVIVAGTGATGNNGPLELWRVK